MRAWCCQLARELDDDAAVTPKTALLATDERRVHQLATPQLVALLQVRPALGGPLGLGPGPTPVQRLARRRLWRQGESPTAYRLRVAASTAPNAGQGMLQ